MTNDTTQIPDDLLAQIEAELAATKARILDILGSRQCGDNPFAIEAELSGPLQLTPYRSTTDKTIFSRQRELRSIITSFEKRVGDEYDLGVVLRQFADAAPLRLYSVTFFSSGAVSFMGLDAFGRSANIYDTLDHFSVILKKLRRRNKSKPRKPVEFYTVIDQD